jgi:hypothetical protein
MDVVECIVCNKRLDNTFAQEGNVQPMDGLRFRTYGHYGSTVFDPVTTGESLVIAVCDACILENHNRIYGNGAYEIIEIVETLERIF